MSIYATIPGLGDDGDDEALGAPWVYCGSHILPREDDPRGGAVDLAMIPSHITRDGRDDQPADGTPWPWLRLSLDHDSDDPAVIINPAQARHLAAQLTAWADSTGGPVTSRPTRIAIDPNVRVRGGTRAGFEDADGPLVVGQHVQVHEPESGLHGPATVDRLSRSQRLAYLAVDWSTLRGHEDCETCNVLDPCPCCGLRIEAGQSAVTDLIRAPFTPAQVKALNRYQSHGNMHPFTCGNNTGGANVVLIARTDGWHCSEPLCDYRQDWAHAFMADPDAWPKPPFGATARTDVRIVNTRTGQGVATGGNDPDVIGWSWPRAAPAEADERDQPSAGGTLRERYAEALRRAFDFQIIAEWICCDPIKPGHKLCRKGETTREMVASLLSDGEEAAYPSRVLDALMAVRDEEVNALRTLQAEPDDTDLDAEVAVGESAQIVHPWAETVDTEDGGRTVRIPWCGADGAEAGGIVVDRQRAAQLGAMLTDLAPGVSELDEICELPHATIAEEDECDGRQLAELAPLIARYGELRTKAAGLMTQTAELEQHATRAEAENAQLRARLAEIRRYAELVASSCRVAALAEIGEDLLRYLDGDTPEAGR